MAIAIAHQSFSVYDGTEHCSLRFLIYHNLDNKWTIRDDHVVRIFISSTAKDCGPTLLGISRSTETMTFVPHATMSSSLILLPYHRLWCSRTCRCIYDLKSVWWSGEAGRCVWLASHVVWWIEDPCSNFDRIDDEADVWIDLGGRQCHIVASG
jgi:hypothetical protein